VFWVEEDGRVGIGTKIPNDALDVVGDIDATGCLQSNEMTIGGVCLSDRRLKKNISLLESQLELIMALQPVRYDWKAPDMERKGEIGLIAQEVENVIPEMVVSDEKGYKRIRYEISLQIRLIKALQEQQSIIDSQQATIENMQNRLVKMEELERDVTALKELLKPNTYIANN
jgi:hypothetical protein